MCNHFLQAPPWINKRNFATKSLGKALQCFDAALGCKTESDILQAKVEIASMAPFTFPPEFLAVPVPTAARPAAHLLNERGNLGERRVPELLSPFQFTLD